MLTDMTYSEDKERTIGIVYAENEYPTSFAWSYVDFINFAASLAHSEGFYFEKDSRDSKSGIWKSENRESSLLRESLAWSWNKFGSNFTNELHDSPTIKNPMLIFTQLHASFAWSKVNHEKFRYLQNISLDILVSLYEINPLIPANRQVDDRRIKLFLEEMQNYPNIETLTVFLQIPDEDLANLMHSPGAHRWANALREITFAKHFDVQFQMIIGMSSRGVNLHAVYRERLRQLLMPECLCYGTTDDVPD